MPASFFKKGASPLGSGTKWRRISVKPIGFGTENGFDHRAIFVFSRKMNNHPCLLGSERLPAGSVIAAAFLSLSSFKGAVVPVGTFNNTFVLDIAMQRLHPGAQRTALNFLLCRQRTLLSTATNVSDLLQPLSRIPFARLLAPASSFSLHFSRKLVPASFLVFYALLSKLHKTSRGPLVGDDTLLGGGPLLRDDTPRISAIRNISAGTTTDSGPPVGDDTLCDVSVAMIRSATRNSAGITPDSGPPV